MSATVDVPIWLLGLGVLLIFLLGAMLWRNLRELPVDVRVPDLDSFEQALPSIGGMTQAAIAEGNAVEVLQNGDGLFPRLLADIRAAEKTVHLETYVWWRGDICREFAETFAERARAGVEVRVMLDAVGALKMDKRLKELMCDAGCKVERYHSLHLRELGVLNKRTHRKLAILDGRIGYVMGHGIAEEWVGNGQDKDHWRDTGVRLQGPIVNQVQAIFAHHWVEETGEVLIGEQYFPHLEKAGEIRVHALAGAPLGGVSGLELMFKIAIATAQRKLWIQNPYFIPDEESARLLERAVQRGVDVRIMFPGPHTDSKIVKHAGHFFVADLLRKGVKLYEHQKTLIHQKIILVDGLWSHVGSTNIDDRSFDINEEAGVGIIDEAVARELEAAFEEDMKSCRQLELVSWETRSHRHRAVDWLCYRVNGQL